MAIFKSLNFGIGTSALGLESEMELELLLISQTSLFPVPQGKTYGSQT